MKKYYCLALLIFTVFTGVSQEKKWTLQECVEYALENNISVKQSELDVELAELDQRDAVGDFFPDVSASASNSWNTGLTQNVTTGVLQTQTTRNFSAGVTANMNLFDGLRNFKRLQRSKISKLAAQYALDKMKDDITLFVVDAYLQVLFNKQNLEVLISQNEITQKQLERTKALVDAGAAAKEELLEIEATNADERQRIIVTENDIRISLVSLAQTLLIKDYEDFDIVDRDYNIFGTEIMEKSVYDIIERAKEERFEIKTAEINQELAQKDVEIARGAYVPTLGAFFNYNTRESGQGRVAGVEIDPDNPTREIGVVENTGETVVAPNTVNTIGSPLPFFEQIQNNDGITYGLQLSIPIFSGFATRNQVQRSRVNAKRAEYELEQAELDLESDVYQAYTDAQGAFEAYEAALVAAKAQEQAFEYATDRFDVGVINVFDFTQSKLRHENAQREVVRTKYDYIFKLKVLELYFGVSVNGLKF